MEFESFVYRHAADFSRIARAARREWTSEDVRNEAFVLACDIAQRRGRPLDLSTAEDASLLIRSLYNHCVKYAETVVRHAHRLDHPAAGDCDREHHWILDTLAADGGADPLSLLEAAEQAAPAPEDPDPYHSPAAGFAWLLRRFDQRMPDVAAFLLISLSWCYSCHRRARLQACGQWPLPHLSVGTQPDAVRAWRRFKLPPQDLEDTRQLPLELWAKPVQPARGQLWLL